MVLHIEFDNRRTEDMPGIVEGNTDALGHFVASAIEQWPALAQRLLGIVRGVERADWRLAHSRAPFVFPLGVFLLKKGGVEQHQFHQLTGCVGGKDWSAVAGCREFRQQAGVVDVCMGNHHSVQAVRVKGKRRAVAVFLFAAALAHAAIE